jgi:hypothetical protein
MAEDNFNYDPEHDEETGAAKYRLPFALCKSHGIEIQDWWTPRDAWNALNKGGFIDDVSEEYKEYYRQKKRERDKQRRKENRDYQKRKQKQLADPEHNPDTAYTHKDGAISGATKGKPMTFEQADSGNCNPYFGKGFIGYRYNCQTCVAVFIARRNGYDVRALPNLNNKNIRDLSYMTNLAYIDKHGNHPSYVRKRTGERTISWLERTVKEGHIYSLEYGYRGKSDGHIITIERVGGKLRLYDPQTNNERHTNRDIVDYLARTDRHAVMDLTSVTLEEKFCDKIMKKR